ncbi:NAD(P)H-dependent oxidoreductase [Lacrimispora xylanolytica]
METMNQNILDILNFRHACKGFDPEKTVSKEDFETILEAARLSPTSFGFEPWNMIVVQDKELKEKLFPLAWGAQNSLKGGSHFVILLARKSGDLVYNAEYITHMMKEVHHFPDETAEFVRKAFKNFQENDFNLMENDRALFDWASKQTYIVLANMLTAAAFLGVDSCPIEGFDQAKVNELLVKEGLMDPEHFGVSVMAGFGYRAEAPRHEKSRQSISELVKWK